MSSLINNEKSNKRVLVAEEESITLMNANTSLSTINHDGGDSHHHRGTWKRMFSINTITMRDGCTGEILWAKEFNHDDVMLTTANNKSTKEEEQHKATCTGERGELQVWLPKTILERAAISREIKFSSKVAIQNLRLVQNILLDGIPLEEWKFVFGFVVPDSVNTWQQVIRSAPQVMDANRLSGHLTIETLFFNGDQCMNKSTWRIHYCE